MGFMTHAETVGDRDVHLRGGIFDCQTGPGCLQRCDSLLQRGEDFGVVSGDRRYLLRAGRWIFDRLWPT